MHLKITQNCNRISLSKFGVATHQLSQNSSTERSPGALGSDSTQSWWHRLSTDKWATADCGSLFFSAEDTQMLHTSEPRGEVVVGAWSPSVSDLIRPLPSLDTRRPRWGFGLCSHVYCFIFTRWVQEKAHLNKKWVSDQKTYSIKHNLLLLLGHKIFIRFIWTLYIVDFSSDLSEALLQWRWTGREPDTQM